MKSQGTFLTNQLCDIYYGDEVERGPYPRSVVRDRLVIAKSGT